MEKASGNYFIILDSDVIVPTQYLLEVKEGLTRSFTDAQLDLIKRCFNMTDANNFDAFVFKHETNFLGNKVLPLSKKVIQGLEDTALLSAGYLVETVDKKFRAELNSKMQSEQVRFKALLKSDASSESKAFQHLIGLNVRDLVQIE